MSFLSIVGLCLLGIVGVYVLIRLISKAVFKSYWEERFKVLIKSSFSKKN